MYLLNLARKVIVKVIVHKTRLRNEISRFQGKDRVITASDSIYRNYLECRNVIYSRTFHQRSAL